MPGVHSGAAMVPGVAEVSGAAEVSGVASATSEALGAQLVTLVKLLVAMRQHAPVPHPAVDHTHYPVLFALAAGPQRISDLAGCAHADISTVSRQVTHLVHHGLLVKVADPDDGRAHRVSLTDDGRTAIDRTITARGEWLAAIMSDWSDADARAFLDQLNRFADSLETAKARAERTAR